MGEEARRVSHAPLSLSCRNSGASAGVSKNASHRTPSSLSLTDKKKIQPINKTGYVCTAACTRSKDVPLPASGKFLFCSLTVIM